MLSMEDVRRLHLGHFTVPEGVDDSRVGQKIVVCAYLIRHPEGFLLFDTGIGEGHPRAEVTYRPVRRPLDEALRSAGVTIDEVKIVANCHLHFDHSGGNFRFPVRPIFAQRIELEAVREPDYTIPEVVADFEGATFELLDGEAEVLPGVRIVPTPGHVPGHQSLVVETREGRLVIAGQAFNEASRYAMAHYALQVEGTGEPVPEIPEWVRRLDDLDPVKVVFAHDLAVWEAEPGPRSVSSSS
jgi:glyoxylase-like metal-dependent hydrolase (beta-lactamase superfamily II)